MLPCPPGRPALTGDNRRRGANSRRRLAHSSLPPLSLSDPFFLFHGFERFPFGSAKSCAGEFSQNRSTTTHSGFEDCLFRVWCRRRGVWRRRQERGARVNCMPRTNPLSMPQTFLPLPHSPSRFGPPAFPSAVGISLGLPCYVRATNYRYGGCSQCYTGMVGSNYYLGHKPNSLKSRFNRRSKTFFYKRPQVAEWKQRHANPNKPKV